MDDEGGRKRSSYIYEMRQLEASGDMAVTANAALCTAGDRYPSVIIIFKSYALNGLVYYGNIKTKSKVREK